MTTLKHFNRNKNTINRFVRGFLAKKKTGIVHGTRATNAQLPLNLNRETLDWDVLVKKPKLKAMQLEKKLDKRFRSDSFDVKKGTGSPGVQVYKVKSKESLGGESFVDFASTSRAVPSISKRGVKFATLKDQKARALENVKNPELMFRRAKDLNLLKRIKKFEKVRGRKV